jgi:hypothetical protein
MGDRLLRFTCKVQLVIALSQHAVYLPYAVHVFIVQGRVRLKCDGTRAETRFRLSTKRMSPFK